MKRPTIGFIGRAAFVSVNPLLLLGLFFFVGGWPGVAVGLGLFAVIGSILWASTQP